MAINFKPHDYQDYAINKILENDRYALLLDMGLGKTVSTLTAINELKYNFLEIDKVLIVAPKKVAEDTWSREIFKWSHLNHLTISKILGSERDRRKALLKQADIYIINRENVKWLVEYFAQKKKWPFDMIVIDELSSFKNPQSQRFKAFRKVIPLSKRFVGLTGTPAPNGLLDLWSQIYFVDYGKRLGKTFSAYRSKYFYKEDWGFQYKALPGTEETVYGLIDDICVSMKSEDHIKLPERVDSTKVVELNAKEREAYDEMEKNLVLNFVNGELKKFEGEHPGETAPSIESIIAKNAAVLSGKLIQLSNGVVYNDDGQPKVIHDKKIEMLSEIIEEANSSPILVFYNFKHDRDRILDKFPQAKTIDEPNIIAKWNDGEIPILLAHPASAGHGLNLQDGGHIIAWFGVTWNLELYQQANARLYRQGQEHTTVIHHIVTKDTIEEQKVLPTLQSKEDLQNALMSAVKAKWNEYEEDMQ